MAVNYLHYHKDFKDLIMIVSEEKGIDPVLVEKDYWVMHGLYGLQQAGYLFKLKGGTSLSKGYEVIDRFSEDIDIHIHPPEHLGINENPKNTKPNNIRKRLEFYDQLVQELEIDGFEKIERDVTYDDTRYYRSGGIRLYYPSFFDAAPGIKEGNRRLFSSTTLSHSTSQAYNWSFPWQGNLQEADRNLYVHTQLLFVCITSYHHQ